MIALGMVELNSIPKGIEAADAMLKAADVQLTAAHSVCAGKYIAVVSGEVAAVRASVAAAEGLDEISGLMAESVVIPSPHKDLLTSLM